METPRHWRMRTQRYALKGEVCAHCGAKVFPPRPICPYCGHGLVQHTEYEQSIVIPVMEYARVERIDTR